MTTLDITPYTNDIAQRMFFDTADQNYIGARAAFFDGRDWDFWWLSLHATEKYLKTILLMNGASAKNGGHNIIGLLETINRRDQRLAPPPFVRPRIAGLDGVWVNYSDALFFERLNEYGSASNRYGTYGYTLMVPDLLRVDQLIFWARRHARGHVLRLHNGATIDWVERLAQSPQHWVQHTGPLEKIAALKPQDRRRRPLTHLNAAFFPRARHTLRSWRSSATNPPIAAWCERLTNSPRGSDVHRAAREVLQWVLDNIQLDKTDRRVLTALLAAHPLP